MMANTASVYEVAFQEINTARLSFAKTIRPFVSRDWILRHVFKLSDEDISRLDPLDDFARQVFEGA